MRHCRFDAKTATAVLTEKIAPNGKAIAPSAGAEVAPAGLTVPAPIPAPDPESTGCSAVLPAETVAQPPLVSYLRKQTSRTFAAAVVASWWHEADDRRWG